MDPKEVGFVVGALIALVFAVSWVDSYLKVRIEMMRAEIAYTHAKQLALQVCR